MSDVGSLGLNGRAMNAGNRRWVRIVLGRKLIGALWKRFLCANKLERFIRATLSASEG